MLKPREYQKLKPKFISSSDLAKCFACKIGYASQYIVEKNRYPLFSRARITGGEPLASSEDTLRGFSGNFYEGTVQFWREFFLEFNKQIDELLADDRIRLVQADQFKPLLRQGKFDKPTWITLKKGKITIRFDTNGLLFCSRKNATEFLDAIYSLNKEKAGSHLYVEIDYSLKGATPTEFKWSQRKQINHFEQSRRSEEVNFENHPQFKGIKHIIEISNGRTAKDPDLKDCLYLTVEKGIENHIGKCYLYHEHSLRWEEIECEVNKKLKLKEPFRLSEVKNTIQWAKSYGMKPYLQRYLNRGAKIILECGTQTIECNPENSGYLDVLIGAKKRFEAEGKACIIILRPVQSPQIKIENFLA